VIREVGGVEGCFIRVGVQEGTTSKLGRHNKKAASTEPSRTSDSSWFPITSNHHQ
jgi:hypothetical protein